MSETLIEDKDLKIHFFTDEGVVRAVDGSDLTVERGKLDAVPAGVEQRAVARIRRPNCLFRVFLLGHILDTGPDKALAAATQDHPGQPNGHTVSVAMDKLLLIGSIPASTLEALELAFFGAGELGRSDVPIRRVVDVSRFAPDDAGEGAVHVNEFTIHPA